MTEKEMRDGHQRIIEMDTESGSVQILHPGKENKTTDQLPVRKTFTFDAVYDWNSKQSDIYDETARPLVDSVLEGFNCTIFAYGQTGTGKTYTMEGIKDDSDKRGIIPNSFDHIFSHIARCDNNTQYLVRASYLEIYQESIRDLLFKDQTKRLELKERADTGVYVDNLTSFVCKSVKEIFQGMNIGNQNRSVGATNMNEHSSRSHAIFIITVEHSTPIGEDGQSHIRVGKLNLVDLAGSERQAKTGTTGVRQKEAIQINLSLSALGNVISALVDAKSTHIPYRDSKLTRLLQDSLGGNSKTVMIANVGPASYNYEETLTTLRYANRAKNIKNKPRVNEDPKDALLREFQMEIERLKRMLEERKTKKVKRKANKESMTSSVDSVASIGSMENVSKLTSKIEAMESKLLTGGKNIVDHTNQQERELEKRREEIAHQKRKERDMRRLLEDKEEKELGILKETFTSLQQEVEIKRRKLKKLVVKLQGTKAEVTDLYESNATERRNLEEIQNDLMKELSFKYLILDNFIPKEERRRILETVTFDEDQQEWKFLERNTLPNLVLMQELDRIQRPLTNSYSKAVNYPVSSYARIAATVGPAFRYRGDCVLDGVDLITPPSYVRRGVPEYSNGMEEEMNLTTSPREMTPDDSSSISSKEFRIIIDKKSGRPKTSMGSRSATVGPTSRPKTGMSRSKSSSRVPNNENHPQRYGPDTVAVKEHIPRMF